MVYSSLTQFRIFAASATWQFLNFLPKRKKKKTFAEVNVKGWSKILQHLPVIHFVMLLEWIACGAPPASFGTFSGQKIDTGLGIISSAFHLKPSEDVENSANLATTP